MWEQVLYIGMVTSTWCLSGLLLVREGLLSSRTRVRADRKSNPEAVRPRDWTYCSHKPGCNNKTDRSVLMKIITMIFFLSTRECWYSPPKRQTWCSKRQPLCILLLFLRHVMPLNDGNNRLTWSVVKRRCARGALTYTLASACLNMAKTTLPQ